jgi:hypothetical protein
VIDVETLQIQGELPNWSPNYNVAPTHLMPVARPIDDGREIALTEWGLIPFCSKDEGTRSNEVSGEVDQFLQHNRTSPPAADLHLGDPPAARSSVLRVCLQGRHEIKLGRTEDCKQPPQPEWPPAIGTRMLCSTGS